MQTHISIHQLNVFYGDTCALKDLSLDIRRNEIFSIIGPANSGKSSFLQSLNRLNEMNPLYRKGGTILLDGTNIDRMDVEDLRARVGIVFALPFPLPMSIGENITYGPRMHGIRQKAKLAEIVERSLREAYLWDEVKDRLHNSALGLSGGQQQRICIARTLAVNPDIILMDEPASALDPISTSKIEELIHELKKYYTIIIVTHNMQQAARTSDITAFFYLGELVEMDKTRTIFTNPAKKQTEDYISGRFG